MDKDTEQDIKTLVGFLGKVGVGIGAILLAITLAPFRVPHTPIEKGAEEIIEEIDKWVDK
jgi:hypothetical protein